MGRLSIGCLTLILCLFVGDLDAATMRIHYDTGFGNRITVRGDAESLSWFSGRDARWSSGNVWILDVPESDGGFTFKPLLNDRVWSKGANYTVPSGDAVVDIYPFFLASRGRVDRPGALPSTALGNAREVFVYLPPSYDENPLKHYPVLYMHDGNNLFFGSTSFGGVEWQVDETLDAMIPAGAAREVIVVGLGNTSNRIGEYTPVADPSYGGGQADAYLDFIENEVMPWAADRYRVLTGPEHTFIGGSSLGGLVSFYGAWTRSHVYGSAICMSSSFWWNEEWMVNRTETFSGPPPGVDFYIDSGSDIVEPTYEMVDALEDLGYVQGDDLHHVHVPSHAHNEIAWRIRFPIAVGRLLPWNP